VGGKNIDSKYESSVVVYSMAKKAANWLPFKFESGGHNKRRGAIREQGHVD